MLRGAGDFGKFNNFGGVGTAYAQCQQSHTPGANEKVIRREGRRRSLRPVPSLYLVYLAVSERPFPHFLPGNFFTIEQDGGAVDFGAEPGGKQEPAYEQGHAEAQLPPGHGAGHAKGYAGHHDDG